MQQRLEEPNGEEEREEREHTIMLVEPRDPAVVHPPTERQGEPWQSRFIWNPNQPPPPVLATRFFPPPPWFENLEGDNLTILPVVGPFLSFTEEQVEVPPGFGRFPEFFEREHRLFSRSGSRYFDRPREERREDRIEAREERRERRGRRRRQRDRDDIRAPLEPEGGVERGAE